MSSGTGFSPGRVHDAPTQRRRRRLTWWDKPEASGPEARATAHALEPCTRYGRRRELLAGSQGLRCATDRWKWQWQRGDQCATVGSCPRRRAEATSAAAEAAEAAVAAAAAASAAAGAAAAAAAGAAAAAAAGAEAATEATA